MVLQTLNSCVHIKIEPEMQPLPLFIKQNLFPSLRAEMDRDQGIMGG